ncbi:YfiT family bacillithiol transferase [Metabacillus iocasae]|uniref:Putative metal-dependent hydrolase JOC83_002408 n=1 Tax=Priestia iocasae TaxID=2291674 RepID=A0ABS2QVR4_9BACI|nr:bacillithiol transferase BstA [Metabacillus iocasae]MBM7703559.1 putative damage-inducible protein DinB [Metabacillus iocasae]
MKDARYPIGLFQQEDVTDEKIERWMKEIEELPKNLREVVEGLKDEQLDTPYREGGWTVRQVIHHVADSHMNSYIRFKLALTENNPTIKPYEEAEWAKLGDSTLPIEVSLSLVEGIHTRWGMILKGLSEQERNRSFYHPESGVMTLETAINMYAWHGNHHVAHIQALREKVGW